MAACSVMTEIEEVKSPINPVIVSVITSDNAREMQAKGVIARKQRELEKMQELNRLRKVVDCIPQITPVMSTEDFQGKTLLRVRNELSATLDMLEGETDPSNRTKLAQAIEKLGELERRLANRPMPPVVKASAQPTKRRQTFAEPIPLSEPGPQVQEAKTCDPFSEVGMPENR